MHRLHAPCEVARDVLRGSEPAGTLGNWKGPAFTPMRMSPCPGPHRGAATTTGSDRPPFDASLPWRWPMTNGEMDGTGTDAVILV